VLLATGLVAATATVVGIAVIQAISAQVDAETDRRLVDSANAFRAQLDDKAESVLALAQWIADEPEIAQAIAAGDQRTLQSRIADPLRLPDVDEVLVAAPDGAVLGGLRADGFSTIAQIRSSGFLEARAGRDVSGAGLAPEDVIAIEAYAAIGNTLPAPVVRVASFVDARPVYRFRERTGVHITLSYGQSHFITSLRDDHGFPLPGSAPGAEAYRATVASGQSLHGWQDLPEGRARAFSVPLNAPDGSRVGMITALLPVNTTSVQLRQAALPALPLAGLAVAIAGFAGFLLTRRMYQPVLGLSEAAARLRQGDLSTPIPPVSQPDLEPLAHELERARVSIQRDVEQHLEMSRMRERLLFHVAHELRGPTTVLDNALELLASRAENETVRQRMVPLAWRTARQITSLTGNLLSAANIQSGRFVIHPQPTALGAVVSSAIEITSSAAEARLQSFDLPPELDHTEVMADPEYLQLVLVNLFSNASKYSPHGAPIKVSLQGLSGQIRVEVRDQGIGIPSEEQPRIFEAFYRAPGDRTAPGLGLGLSIVKEVVEAHGGIVGVDSAPDRGTTVWFTLPAVA
jgi:signal transduction histidine kinase